MPTICIVSFFCYFSKQVCTILVLNYHHRLASGDPMPRWVQTLFLQWIPWALRISRPGNKITRKSINIENKVGYTINEKYTACVRVVKIPMMISLPIIRKAE